MNHTNKALITLSILGVGCSVSGIVEANSISSDINATVIEKTKVTPPAFGDDPWDSDNKGSGIKGVLTIDRVPSFIWNKVSTTPENGKKTIETGKVINENSYLQISDTRGTLGGYRVMVSFKQGEKWIYDDGLEADPAGISFDLKKENIDSKTFVKPTTDSKDAIAPTVKNALLNIEDEFPVLVADKGQGAGTWGIWWRDSNLSMSPYVTRGSRTLKSRAIVWSLYDGPS